MSVEATTKARSFSLQFRSSLRDLSKSRELGLLLLIIIASLYATYEYPQTFPTFDNTSAILRNLALDAILATGMMLLLIGGDFDLSIGGMFSLIGVLTGWLLKESGLPVAPCILLGLGAAALGGLVNGFIVSKLKVNALITTLGTMQVYRGLAIVIGGPGISFLPEGFTELGQAKYFGLQSPVYLMVFIVILFQYLLTKTRFFRRFYYMGGNEKAAQLSGINVDRTRIVGFMVMGILAGLAGMTFASRLGTGISTAGDGKELAIITAVILGGASLKGGRGTIWGALLGVVFIALINNLMIQARISANWHSIVIGTVLIAAVAMDYFLQRD